jgi:hypothetical protein
MVEPVFHSPCKRSHILVVKTLRPIISERKMTPNGFRHGARPNPLRRDTWACILNFVRQ